MTLADLRSFLATTTLPDDAPVLLGEPPYREEGEVPAQEFILAEKLEEVSVEPLSPEGMTDIDEEGEEPNALVIW